MLTVPEVKEAYKDFYKITEAIAAQRKIDPFDKVPFLALENVEQRVEINVKLAEAHFNIHEFDQAELLITRAFVLSDFSEEILPVVIKIAQKTGNIPAIKFAYKRIGIKLFREGKIAKALSMFNEWQYAYFPQSGIDRYEHDYEIQNTIDLFCSEHRTDQRFKKIPAGPGKMKIGYLLVHFLDPGSVLIKLDKLFVEYHDKEKFDITYFVMEQKTTVFASAHGRQLDKFFTDHGCSVVYMDIPGSKDAALFNFAEKIGKCNLNIFITNAVLANFEHYFIASFKPASLLLAVVHGPVAQYVTNIFDHAISSYHAQTVDVPCNCTQVNIELKPEDMQIEQVPKKPVDHIPGNSVVLICGGRTIKFRDKRYWASLLNILLKYPNASLFIIGFKKEQYPFPELLIGETEKRISFFEWTVDYLSIIKQGHIYIDSYPVGGGVFMIEAMRAGLPPVYFEHDYYKYFTGEEGSGGQQLVGIPDLCIPRENFDEFEKKVGHLIENREERNRFGEICKQKILAEISEPARMVKRYEAVYLKLISDGLTKQVPAYPKNSGGKEPDLFMNLDFSTMIRYFARSLRLRLVRKLRG